MEGANVSSGLNDGQPWLSLSARHFAKERPTGARNSGTPHTES